MTKDRSADVFSINFDFVNGERPDATKLTALPNLIDIALSDITKYLGDPQDESSHSGGSPASTYTLSPNKLAQNNLARIIGPSDYGSPVGASWNEAITSSTGITVTLEANRNQWRLGFPLVKKTSSDISPFSTGGYSSYFTNLSVGTDIVSFSGASGEFLSANRKTDAEDVVDSGDWHIDFSKGIITTYNIISSTVTFKIKNINMLGPGTPWGTSNVIPTWNQTSSLCTCTWYSGTSPAIYIITLPSVDEAVRKSSTGSLNTIDSTWATKVSGGTALHRLPYSFTANLATGDEIPEGAIYLYDEIQGRIISSNVVTFYYEDENSIKVEVPTQTSINEGERYRLILTGTSLSENVNYLINVLRDGTHNGLENAFDGNTPLYMNPISHDNLSDLYTGNIPAATTNIEKFNFTKSDFPLNPHPQYLSRVGYMSDNGNVDNSMKGNLAFCGNVTNFPIGTNWTSRSNSYGIKFGGNESYYAYINHSGGGSETSYYDFLPFGIDDTGIVKNNSLTTEDKYGALTIQSYRNYPVYFKSYGSDSYDSGASLGFDFKDQGELNYIKVFSIHNTSYATANVPANTSSMSSFSTELEITPTLSDRLSPEQLREWRFRAISENTATNTGLGSPFSSKFVSPGIVGADFLNVYSNAIFFSREGNGIKTSLHDNYSWFNNSSQDRPIGFYYEPASQWPFYDKFTLYSAGKYGITGVDQIAYFGYDKAEIAPPASEAKITITEGTYERASLIAGSAYIRTQRYTTGATKGQISADAIEFTSAGEVDITGTLLDVNTTTIDIDTTSHIYLTSSGGDIINSADSFSVASSYFNGIMTRDVILFSLLGDISITGTAEINITGYDFTFDCNHDFNLDVSNDISISSASDLELNTAYLSLYATSKIYIGNGSSSNGVEIQAGKNITASNGQIYLGASSGISLACDNAITSNSALTNTIQGKNVDIISNNQNVTINTTSNFYLTLGSQWYLNNIPVSGGGTSSGRVIVDGSGFLKLV